MTTANPYFLYPFAAAADPSDVVEIDNTGGTTGPLSYQYGFTPNYEEDLSTIPSALPVPRPQFNQLMLDITSALQQLQLAGAPLWVAPAVGSAQGGPVSYPMFARVAYTASAPYGFQIWESQINANTSIPGDDNNWVIVSGGRGIAPGTYIDSASPNGYIGALLCDGAAYARATYPLLFSALTLVATCTTNSTAVVTVPSNVIALLSAYTGDSPGSFACYVEGSNIDPNTYITVIGATTITLSAAASSSGSFVLTFLPYGYGISGSSSTFGVPNCLRTVSVAAGGSGNSVLGNKVGNKGGGDTYTQKLTDVFNHTHNFAYSELAANVFLGLASTSLGTGLLHPLSTTTPMNGRAQSGDTNSDQTDMNIIQQSNIVFRYIKF
jgi:hypothetical protein